MEFDNKPTLFGEIKKARASNYDFTRAINEFIDNSLDTDATEIIIELKNYKNKPETIRISDNSTNGINNDILSKIFCWTYDRKRPEKEIGEFGTGFKAASVNLGDKITVFTYDAKNKTYLKCIADWIDMSENNIWVPKKITITKDDYETSTNHPFIKGSSFLIERILHSRHPRFDENAIEKIANIYKYILKSKPKIKITVKLDNNQFNLREKTYYNFDCCEFEYETKISIYKLKDDIETDELNMIATFVYDGELDKYVTPTRKMNNGNYSTKQEIFKSRNYVRQGVINFRSCHDTKMRIIDDKIKSVGGPEPELPKGSVDIIRHNRIIGDSISTFIAPRGDGYANYIKHELSYEDKIFDDYLGISFNKTTDGHIPENNLKYLLHFLIKEHQKKIINDIDKKYPSPPKKELEQLNNSPIINNNLGQLIKKQEDKKEVVNKEVVNKEVLSKEVLSKEVLCKEVSSKEDKKEVVNKEVLNKEVLSKEDKKDVVSKEVLSKEVPSKEDKKEKIQSKKELVQNTLNKNNIVPDSDSSDDSEKEYDENKLLNDMVKRDINNIKTNFTYYKPKKCIKQKTDKEYFEHFSKLLIKKLSETKYE